MWRVECNLAQPRVCVNTLIFSTDVHFITMTYLMERVIDGHCEGQAGNLFDQSRARFSTHRTLVAV